MKTVMNYESVSRTKKLCVLEFSDVEEAVDYARHLPPRYHSFINCGQRGSKSFNGFDAPQPMIDEAINGLSHVKMLDAAADGDLLDAVEKFKSMRLSEDGGFEIDVGQFCSGEPAYYRDRAVKRVKSKVISVVIDVGVHCGITVGQLKDGGTKIAHAIMAIENAGYQVEVDTLITGIDTTDIAIVTRIKDASESINPGVFYYPMLSPCFFRGVCFTIMGCEPDYKTSPSLGHPAYGKEFDHLVKAAFEEDRRTIRMLDVIENRMSEADIVAKLLTWEQEEED